MKIFKFKFIDSIRKINEWINSVNVHGNFDETSALLTFSKKNTLNPLANIKLKTICDKKKNINLLTLRA